jgi:hypothetical protein
MVFTILADKYIGVYFAFYAVFLRYLVYGREVFGVTKTLSALMNHICFNYFSVTSQ